ncbi:MAG: hypothetical protein ACI80V_001349 [Rhodothermales bacterium]|jgi:hypothetical protein
MNESCWPDGLCVFERENRPGQIEFWVENRSERDSWVRIDFTDLYNWRSNERLPFTGLFTAGKSKRALRLTKPSPQEVSRKRRRTTRLLVPVPEAACVEEVGCVSVSFDDKDIVFTFTNVSEQRRLVTITLTRAELLRVPDRPIQEMIKAGDADEVGRVRIEDIWGAWRYGYTFTADPAS